VELIKTEVVDDKERRDTRGRRIVAAERREELLAAYDASGMTQSAFARREGISLHTLVAWLGRRRSEKKAVPAVHFREVCLAPAAKIAAALKVTLPSGVIVRGANVAAVVELVRALRA
jgi:transposase-like protein